jgi:hypothetical protein
MNPLNDFADSMVGTTLLLFTGAEVVSSNTAIELITKLGVIAVLWFWLRDLKKQMKDQLDSFEKRTDEVEDRYEKILADKVSEYKDYKERMDKIMAEKTEEVRLLQSKLFEKK